ncbi:HEAT repeat domain-containing protein [Oscillatoria sp. CS-180]|uniref:HEAT repeat domain-containing protein n=1 Tax=Oscillatoria sp. CS-180 TaxID=3021720 RepID=UPI00232FD7B7|nr:HEAT repeat domain-containing protein [Oscillatoria sp. CS-180]MDB9527930.1 HEAT repeat domain-containing protein [Oscillatoria sp. CS-180]
MPSLKAILSPLVLSVSVVVSATITPEALASDCQSLDVVRAQLLSGVNHRPYNALMRCRNQAVPVLIKILKSDESSDVRWRAADALERIEGDASQIAPPLMEALSSDESEPVRWKAAEALGRIEGDASQIVPALMEALKSDENSKVRASAADALGSMEGDASQIVPALMEALKDDESPNVRSGAAWILLRIEGDTRQITAALMEALKDDESPNVRDSVANVLGYIEGDTRQITAALMEALKDDESSDVRWRAASALVSMEGDASEIAPILVEALQSDENSFARERVADALGRISFNAQSSLESLSDIELSQIINTLKTAVMIAETQEGISSQQVEAIQVPLQALIREQDSRRLKRIARPTVSIFGTHLLFWLTLIGLYPRYPWVQAIFFWNPWVRRIAGAGYVGPALAWIPFLRAKLFSPFQASLLADAELENFSPGVYFAASEVIPKGTESPQPLANAIPDICGQIILEGASGLGKSMALRQRVCKSRRIVVYLPAQKCSQGVIEAIQAKLHGPAQDPDFLRNLIYSGALDICIDGLNEVTADTRAKITSFVESYFKGNIIMATQPLEWRPPSTSKTFVLQPLKQSQIAEFLISRQDYLPSQNKDQASYLDLCKAYLERAFDPAQLDDERLAVRSILSNPMDLTLVAQMLAHGQEPNLLGLQQQQYEIMAEDYQTAHLHRFPLAAFSEAVYQMRLNDEETIPAAQFLDELRCLERYKMVLSRQSADLEGNPTQSWFFRHDKIMEFFIVQTFLGPDNTRPQEHMGDPRFRGVYFLLANLLPFNAAMQLRESLIRYAADNQDHNVSDGFIKLLISREATTKTTPSTRQEAQSQ